MNKFTPVQKKFIHILHREGDKWSPYKQRGRRQALTVKKDGCLSLLGAVIESVGVPIDAGVTGFDVVNALEKVEVCLSFPAKIDCSDFATPYRDLIALHECTSLSLHNIAQLMEAVPWMFFSNFKTPAYLVSWGGIYIHAQYGKPDLDISQVLDSCTPPQWRSRMDRAYKLRLESLSKEYSE